MGQLRRGAAGPRVCFGDVFVAELARSLARGVAIVVAMVALEVARHAMPWM